MATQPNGGPCLFKRGPRAALSQAATLNIAVELEHEPRQDSAIRVFCDVFCAAAWESCDAVRKRAPRHHQKLAGTQAREDKPKAILGKLRKMGNGKEIADFNPLPKELWAMSRVHRRQSAQKRRKKMGSSVAYKTIGTFLSQKMGHEECLWVGHRDAKRWIRSGPPVAGAKLYPPDL